MTDRCRFSREKSCILAGENVTSRGCKPKEGKKNFRNTTQDRCVGASPQPLPVSLVPIFFLLACEPLPRTFARFILTDCGLCCRPGQRGHPVQSAKKGFNL